MKKSAWILIIGIIICAVCCYQERAMIRKFVRNTAGISPEITQACPVAETSERESITFILGEDKDENLFYQEATYYYTNHPTARTDYVVSACRSLVEVNAYLSRNRPCNKLPWGLIHLVTHGNQWTGLSVRVVEGAKRTTTERLEQYLESKTIIPLPDSVIDAQTEIFLHGCGVGNDPTLVNTLAKAFGRDGSKPTVRASRMFEYYASIKHGGDVHAERYLAKAWFVNYKMGELPGKSIIVNELREKYPEAVVDWSNALERKKPLHVGNVYHYTFEVPVKWIVRMDHDSLPDLTTEENQMTWLKRQQVILDELHRLNMSVDKFNWSFYRIYVTNDDGTKSLALWVKGFCTILCVLQAMTDGYDESLALQKPFVPHVGDNRYYYSTDIKPDEG